MTTDTETLRMIGEVKGELGEVKGQLRELIHNTNNLRQSFEIYAPQVHSIAGILSEVSDLKARIAVLEASEHQRAGAMSLGSTILKSPLIGWIMGAAAIIYSYLRK